MIPIKRETPSQAQVRQRRQMSAQHNQTQEARKRKDEETRNGNARIEGGQAEINAYLRRGAQRW